MMRTATAILGACGLFLLAAATAVAAETTTEWPGRTGRYVFEITRDGDPIGTQSIEIARSGDTVIATTESKIAVEFLGIVVYRMRQILTETYEGSKLVAVRAETKDPDGFRVGDIKRSGDRWKGKLDKENRDFECDCMATTMWHVDSLKGSAIIETPVTQRRSIIVEDQGMETVNLPEGPVETRHFVIKGEIEREAWFGPQGNLVAAEQIGSDGSLIRQVLTSAPAASGETEAEAGTP
jgi:hypothetical protein